MAIKSQYLIINPGDLGDLANQLNRVLAQIGDRLDQISGDRGTPEFNSDVDLKGHKVTNAGLATAATDLATLAQVAGGSTDHGLLLGLTDDDHSQYAKLGGRAGGQTMKGGTGASENLILQSTSHATRGYVKCEDSFEIFDVNAVLIHGFLKS